MKRILTVLLGLFTTLSLGAQSFEQVAASAHGELVQAGDQLESFKEQIVMERQPLQAEESRLKDRAFELRAELGRILRRRDNTDRDLRSLENDVEARKDENDYLTSLMGEYIRAFDNRLHISERQLHAEQVEEAKLATEDINLSAADRFNTQLKVINSAITRLENIVGGHQFSGKGILPGGLLKEGTFTALGPIVFFSSPNNNASGMASREFGSSQPTTVSLGEELDGLISNFSQNMVGPIPVDATLGAAVQVEASKDTILEVIEKGGIVIYFILALAGIALIVAIFKFIEISGVRRARPQDLSYIIEALNKGNRDDAMQYAQKIGGPVGRLLTAAVESAGKDKDHVEEVLYQQMITTQPRLERFLPFIAVTAGIAPLLGLLGTVTGMITTFKLITIFGTGDAKSLSTGISEALITTEFGLIVAIPSLILHALLSRKAKGVLGSMERTAIGFINGLPGRP